MIEDDGRAAKQITSSQTDIKGSFQVFICVMSICDSQPNHQKIGNPLGIKEIAYNAASVLS